LRGAAGGGEDMVEHEGGVGGGGARAWAASTSCARDAGSTAFAGLIPFIRGRRAGTVRRRRKGLGFGNYYYRVS